MPMTSNPKRTMACALALVTGVALADSSAAANGQRKVTLELGVGASYVDLPGIDGTAAAVTDNRAGTPVGAQFGNLTVTRQPRINGSDLEDTGPMGLIGLDIPISPAVPFANVSLVLEAVIAGYDDTRVGNSRLADDGMPPAVATGEFFELLGLNGTILDAAGNTGLSGVRGPGSIGVTNVSNAANVVGNVGFIAGPFGQGALGLPPAGQTVTTVIRSDADYIEGRFLFAGDGPTSHAVTPRWSAGFIVADLDQDYNVRQDARVSGFGNISQTLDEELDTFIIGPAVGVDLNIRPGTTPNTTWTLSGELAALYMDTDLTARQRADWTGLGPPTPGPFGGAPIVLAQTDDESSGAARVNLGVGVEHDFGPMALGLEGSVTWWSYMPQVQNPQARVGDELGVAVSRPAQAQIDDDDMTSGQVLVTAKFPIN